LEGNLGYVKSITKVASSLKAIAEMGNSKEPVDTTAQLFQLMAGLAGKGDAAVQIGAALFQGGKNLFDVYFTSLAVTHLSDATNTQLNGINVLSAKLQGDMLILDRAKRQLDACNNRLSAEQRSARSPKPAPPPTPVSIDSFQHQKDSYMISFNACCDACPSEVGAGTAGCIARCNGMWVSKAEAIQRQIDILLLNKNQ
jgi:hypothetical protein